MILNGETFDILNFDVPDVTNADIEVADIDTTVPEAGPEVGVETLLMQAIRDIYGMIEGYNSLSIALTDIGNESASVAIADIIRMEHSNIGALQDILKEISPNAEAIDVNESLNEDLNTSEIPKEILGFTEMDIDDFKNLDLNDRYNLLKNAYQKYMKDYKEIKKEIDFFDMNDADYEYQSNFYKKYVDFAKKCKEYLENRDSISGYGKLDVFKIKIEDMCKSVDNNFPYGWKPYNWK